MKRFLKYAALAIAAVIVGFVGLVGYTILHTPAIPDGLDLGGVRVLKDGFVGLFMVDVGDKQVALVDGGNDAGGAAVRAELARRGLGPEAVVAVLLTHGDADHVAAAALFPKAEVMALADDVSLAEGRVRRGLPGKVFAAKPTGVKVTRVLRDGDTVSVGNVAVRVFAVPGHTAGSAAYLARGVLFLGDSAEATRDGQLTHGARLFTEDLVANEASLKALARRLVPFAAEVKAIAFGHSGALLRGLAPLTEYAGR